MAVMICQKSLGYFNSPLIHVLRVGLECGASESAGVYVSSLHSQHHAHMCFCCFLMLVKCFAAVPISIPSGRTFIVPAGRLHEKGADSNPYHDYRNFPIVFCLKINHDGAFTKPPKIGYEGSKVNWINNIDSDAFSVNEVSDMMKKIVYDNVAMEFYFKESNTELDKGIRKLATDSDVLEMLKFVSKYKVIDLYVDHSVCKEPVNVDHSISKAIILYEPSNSDKFLDNDADEASNNVANVVQARRNRNVHNLVITEHVANKGNSVSEDESKSEYGSNSDDSDFIVDEENLIHDVDVDMQDFNNNTNANVEWMGCKESVQEVNEVFHVEKILILRILIVELTHGMKVLERRL
ncbi:hypothetical protein Tco_0057541 [Tanacetum coccineum]